MYVRIMMIVVKQNFEISFEITGLAAQTYCISSKNFVFAILLSFVRNCIEPYAYNAD